MPNFIIVRVQTSEITRDRQTDKQTDRPTMPFIYIDYESKTPKIGVRAQKMAVGRNSNFGSDSHTPGHLEYLHTKFHHRATSNKKEKKLGPPITI